MIELLLYTLYNNSALEEIVNKAKQYLFSNPLAKKLITLT